MSEVFRGGNQWLWTVTDPFSAVSGEFTRENSELSRVNSRLWLELGHFQP